MDNKTKDAVISIAGSIALVFGFAILVGQVKSCDIEKSNNRFLTEGIKVKTAKECKFLLEKE